MPAPGFARPAETSQQCVSTPARLAGPALKEQQQQPKPAKPRKPRKSRAAGPKKIAEVIPPEGGDPVAEGAPASGDGGGGATGVTEAVVGRIRKALALGLHQGGNALEKQHAMQRATRLMQQHGVSQAGAPARGLFCLARPCDWLEGNLANRCPDSVPNQTRTLYIWLASCLHHACSYAMACMSRWCKSGCKRLVQRA